MRRLIIAVAVVLVSVSTMAADPASGKTQLSIFTSNLGYSWTERYSERTGGLGLALSRVLTPRWSIELKVADERHIGATAKWLVADPSVTPQFTTRLIHVVPIDLLGQYRFVNRSRWTPYVNAGVHHVFANSASSDSLQGRDGVWKIRSRRECGPRTTGEIGVGTSLRITPHFGLRFDVNRLLGGNDLFYDAKFRPSMGVSWRF